MSRRLDASKRALTSETRRSVRRAQRALRFSELRKRQVADLGEDILRSCRVAITAIHSGRSKEARRELKASTGRFKRFLKLTRSACYLKQWGYAIQVIQEFLEASLLLCACTGERLFPLDDLDSLPDLAILYGVSDLIGELRRKVLTSLTREDTDEALRLFNMMSELYGELSSVSLTDSVAPGLRRKLDVNRSVLEATLSDVTEEVSRRKLTSSMAALAERLQRNK